MFSPFGGWPLFTFKEKSEEDDLDKALKEYIDGDENGERRKDYCYDCGTDELYCHAMTFKCSKCDAIILGGE